MASEREPPPPRESTPSLSALQRWFQAVTTHPGGTAVGAASHEAAEALDARIDEVARPSRHQTAEERLAVYAHGYWARLLECLREEFPIVRKAAGDEAFDGLAAGYLIAHPSTSYTLGRLSDHFPGYLQATLRESAGDDLFGRFVVELARLERAVNEVFDAQGGETSGYLACDELENVSPDARATLRLQLLPTVRLLRFEFDVNSFYTTARAEGDELSLPEQRPTYLALSRRGYVVRRHPLEAMQFALLTVFAAGRTLAEAIDDVLCSGAEAGTFPDAEQLRRWFADWARAGLFQSLAK